MPLRSDKKRSPLFRLFTKTAIPSFLSEGTKLSGTLISQGDLTINGFFQGEIRARTIQVLEKGYIQGNITARRIVFCGFIEGDIYAHDIFLYGQGKIKGNVHYNHLKSEDNVFIEGNISQLEDGFLFPSDTFLVQEMLRADSAANLHLSKNVRDLMTDSLVTEDKAESSGAR